MTWVMSGWGFCRARVSDPTDKDNALESVEWHAQYVFEPADAAFNVEVDEFNE